MSPTTRKIFIAITVLLLLIIGGIVIYEVISHYTAPTSSQILTPTKSVSVPVSFVPPVLNAVEFTPQPLKPVPVSFVPAVNSAVEFNPPAAVTQQQPQPLMLTSAPSTSGIIFG